MLEEARYGKTDLSSIPPGYVTVPVHVNNDGHEVDTVMIAGSLGITGSSTGGLLENGETGLDTYSLLRGG